MNFIRLGQKSKWSTLINSSPIFQIKHTTQQRPKPFTRKWIKTLGKSMYYTKFLLPLHRKIAKLQLYGKEVCRQSKLFDCSN